METEVTLRDGSRALLRPVEPRDREAIQSGVERMSPESRYKRFFAPMPRLTGAMLTYLTDIDHHDHEAIAAFTPDTREPMGVARFVRTEPGSDTAEVAVAVVDDYQGRGVATALVHRLVERAREEGVERFTASALADNDDVIDLLHRIGPTRQHAAGGGVVEMEIELPVAAHDESPLRRLVRSAAKGAVAVRDRATRAAAG